MAQAAHRDRFSDLQESPFIAFSFRIPKVLALGALASIPLVWAPVGYWLQHREVGEQNHQKKSKTKNGREERS